MWIDIVFSGGGVKGFAFAGAVSRLEQAGYRFKRTAGTSAGAIVAALLACGYTASEMKELMDEMNTRHLLDPAEKVNFPFIKWLQVYYRMGLFKGKALENWLLQAFSAKGIHTFSDLPADSLRIVVTDASKKRMVVIPDDLKSYGIEPGTFSVARAVRMSAGLPFFFEPVPLFDQGGQRSLIVDGGLLSNFPLWIFEKPGCLPERPFLGVQVSSGTMNQQKKQIHNAVDLFWGIFSAMQDVYDDSTVRRLKESNIIVIPINKVDTKDFDISVGERERLFALGADETDHFLKRWSF